MNNTPLVSVVMPVYNAEKYVASAITSILQQTYTYFEFIIIDDGSTDNTLTIVNSFKDKRIKVFKNQLNSGVVATLNRGLDLAQGKYIARIDADDIALPNRLQKQVDFLNNNEYYGIVGTRIKHMIGDDNTPTNAESVIAFDDHHIRFRALFYTPFMHPTVMVRAFLIKKLKYDANFEIAEDYNLWFEILKLTKGKNLNEVLLYYRIHPNKTGLKRKEQQLHSLAKLIEKQFNYYNIAYTKENIDEHLWLSHCYNHKLLTIEQLRRVEKWLGILQYQIINAEGLNYTELDVKKMISQVWYQTAIKEKGSGLSTFYIFSSSIHCKYLTNKHIKTVLIFIRCIAEHKAVQWLCTPIVAGIRKAIPKLNQTLRSISYKPPSSNP